MNPVVRRTLGLGVAVALVLSVSACGNDNSDKALGRDIKADTSASGKVVITGSSTVEPISTAAREGFVAQNDKVDISVEGPGTADGFKTFCAGDADIADASRPIKEEEIAACEAAGVEFVELAIGIDGLTVITAEDNPLDCLNFADLYALIGPEASGDRWSDAAGLASDLGSDTDLPDDNLVITGPGEESGTYDSFVEIVFKDIAEARVADGELDEDDVGSARSDYSASANDNTISEGVAAEPGGLGWVGFAFADQTSGVKKMPVAAEPGGDCVAPTQATIQDGTYPIARTLYIYVNRKSAEDNEAVPAFVDYYLAGLSTFVEAAGYIALADDSTTRSAWEDRTTGTRVGD